MSQKQFFFTVEETAFILKNLKDKASARGEVYQDCIHAILGTKPTPPTPPEAKFSRLLQERCCLLTAERLVAGDISVPLFHSSDCKDLIDDFVSSSLEASDTDAASKERLATTIRDSIYKMVGSVDGTLNIANGYAANLKQLAAVAEMAAERGLSATELLALPDAYDNLTRRLHTPDEFRSSNQKACETILQSFLNPSLFKQALFKPMLDEMAADSIGLTEDERREAEETFEKDFVPFLEALTAKTRAAITEAAEAEVARIWS